MIQSRRQGTILQAVFKKHSGQCLLISSTTSYVVAVSGKFENFTTKICKIYSNREYIRKNQKCMSNIYLLCSILG